MIIAPLLGAALVVNAATGPLTGSAAGEASLTIKEKAAATEPLVRSATDCIVHAVTSDPRFAAEPRAAVGDLIVEIDPRLPDAGTRNDRWLRSLLWRGRGRSFFHGALSRRAANNGSGRHEQGSAIVGGRWRECATT